MLQNIRDRFTGGFAIAILALIGVPFVFFGINYNFIGQTFAAKVNGEEISVAAFENAYRNELLRYTDQGIDLPAEYRQLIREGVLDSLVREEVVDQYIDESGYRVPDKLVTDFIQRAPEFRENGVFSKELYYSLLAQQAIDPALFEASQRRGLQQGQLQRGIGATAFVTPAEYRRYLNLYAEQRQIALVEVDVETIASSIEITDEDIQAYYDSQRDTYRSPETVDLEYVELNRAEVTAAIQVTDEELREYYRDASSRYLQDERRQARHILLPFGDDEAAAEAEAAALTERARAGEPFEELARTYSKDGGTAEQGGDLGLLSQSQLPGPLGDAIFSMQPGDIAGPVRTGFGFHVIKLESAVEGGPLPLDQVRGELEREIKAQKADEVYLEKERALGDALFDATELVSLAAAAGLEVKTAARFSRNGGEPFGANQAVIVAAFDERALNERHISDIIEIDANRFIVLRVTDHHPSEIRPVDEVRDIIDSTLRNERAVVLADEQAESLKSAMRSNADLDDVQAQFPDYEVLEMIIGRDAAQIDPFVRGAVFDEKKPRPGEPKVGTVITQAGNYAVYSVIAVAPGRPESIPLADRDAGKIRLAQQAGGADYASFVYELVRRADVIKSEEALEQQSLFE